MEEKEKRGEKQTPAGKNQFSKERNGGERGDKLNRISLIG